MRVAYVCVDPGIGVFGTKGASVHVQEVVRELRGRGHDVRVYAARVDREVPADLADLDVVHVPVGPGGPADRERAQRRAAEQIAALILADGADLVYERYSLFSTALATITAGTGIPAVLEVNAPLVDEQRRHRALVDEPGAWAALRAQVGAATATVCVSDPVRTWVERHTGGTRVHTVANGVSVTRIRPQPEAPGPPVVTFVGTLKPWHGVADLIEAATRARTPWRLRVVGDGPERAALAALAADREVAVDFRGAVAPADMPRHLAGSAVGVAPYPRAEHGDDQYFSPLKVYEYLAAGLPVVASAVGQLPGIVADGQTGLLVPPSDPDALAAALDTLAADPAGRARMGTAARQQAIREHSWAGVVDTIMGLLPDEVTVR